MSQKLLPIGVHTFEQIRERNFVYVDKTQMLHSLWEGGSVYFLSRPRRFGKSLLIDTIHQLVLGRKELFTGLWILDKWDWDVVYPVVRFDFGAGTLHTKDDLDERISNILCNHSTKYAVELRGRSLRSQFLNLLMDLDQKYKQKVVVLVDEYDKPILDNLKDVKASEIMRDGLRDIYSVLKSQQASLRFVLLTGVSKFAKVSIFSGLNNLQDISLTAEFATLCGYTQKDVETQFVDWLDGVNMPLMKKWYNGYSFNGEPIYNPFDVLLYLNNKEFKNYWFETGTPDFLVQLIKDSNYSLPDLEQFYSTDDLMNRFDVNNFIIEGFFFQTGYLTIKDSQTLGDGQVSYRLGFPNLEVQKSMSSLFLMKCTPRRLDFRLGQQISRAVLEGKPALMEAPIKQFLNSIPFDWYKFHKMDKYEGYWSSLIYAMFATIGLFLKAEDTSNRGRLDLCLYYETTIFLIEFKMTSNAKDPIQQIKDSGYAGKYRDGQNQIWLVGMTFDHETRNLSKFQWEKDQG